MTQVMNKEAIKKYLQWNARRKKLSYKRVDWNELRPAIQYRGKRYFVEDEGAAHDDIIYAAIHQNDDWDESAYKQAERGFMYKNKFYPRNMFYHSIHDMPIQSDDLHWHPKGYAKFYG